MVVPVFAVWVLKPDFLSSPRLRLESKAKTDSVPRFWSSPLLLRLLLLRSSTETLMGAKGSIYCGFQSKIIALWATCNSQGLVLCLLAVSSIVSGAGSPHHWDGYSQGSWDSPALSSSLWSHVVTEEDLLLLQAHPLLQFASIRHLIKPSLGLAESCTQTWDTESFPHEGMTEHSTPKEAVQKCQPLFWLKDSELLHLAHPCWSQPWV